MFGRGMPLVPVGAAVVIAVAALTTWWVLLALIPLMMAGCMAMMGAMPWMDAWRSEGWGPRMMGFDGTPGRRRETPIEILERRLAEGEISVEEYHQRRDVIAGGAEALSRGSGRNATEESPSENTPREVLREG